MASAIVVDTVIGPMQTFHCCNKLHYNMPSNLLLPVAYITPACEVCYVTLIRT